jgi:hypothetical protein
MATHESFEVPGNMPIGLEREEWFDGPAAFWPLVQQSVLQSQRHAWIANSTANLRGFVARCVCASADFCQNKCTPFLGKWSKATKEPCCSKLHNCLLSEVDKTVREIRTDLEAAGSARVMHVTDDRSEGFPRTGYFIPGRDGTGTWLISGVVHVMVCARFVFFLRFGCFS